MPRRKGIRCAGFIGADGLYEHCERPERAGALPLNERTMPPTYAHKLYGMCKCGEAHNLVSAPLRPSSSRPTTPARVIPLHAMERSQARQTASAAGSSERTPAARRASGVAAGKPDGVSSSASSAKGGAPRRVGRTPEAVYTYTRADGTPVYRVERWRTVDTATGELGKTFRPYRADATAPGGWNTRAGMGDAPHLIYRARELADAPADRRVYIPGGEKCADALAAVGLLATCNDGGALKWRRCAAIAREILAGRHIVILADNDGELVGRPQSSYVGQRHALEVAASLADVAASVRVLLLPGLTRAGDVYDWLADGHTPGELEALAQGAPCYDPAAPAIWRPEYGDLWTTPARPDREPFERIHARGVGDDTTTGGEGGTPETSGDYIAIPGTSWYLTPDGGRIVTRKGRGELEDYAPVYEWSTPIIHALVKFPREQSLTGRAVLYDVEVDGQRERITYGDLHKGAEAWHSWGTLGIAGRTAFANMAATVEYLARKAPVHQGMRATGWIEHTGRHVLVLPSGELVGREGVVSDTLAYLDIAAHHIAPYLAPDGKPITVSPSSPANHAAQSAALHFITDNAARSLAALALCAHIRSIMYGIWRSDCTLIIRGGSGRGKTTISKKGRNLTGAFAPDARGSAEFTGPTAASVEKHMSQLKCLPLALEDLVLRGDMTPGEKAEVGKKTDMVIRSVANNAPVRERQTAKMEDAPAYKIDALPVMTVEELPPEVKESALNRSVLLDVGEGDVHPPRWYEDDALTHDAALRTLGRGFIVWLAGEWDTHGAALAARWIESHRAYTRQVERDIRAARDGRPLPAYADRLPSNAAHLLLAAHVLHTYASAAGVACPITAESIYSDLLAHLVAQIETIDALAAGGNDGEGVGERIGAAVREALARVDAFVTNTDGSDATKNATLKPEQLGYRSTTTTTLTGEYQRATRWLGEITPDGEYLTLDRLALHGLLKHTARVEHWRGWRVSARELAAVLDKAGILEKPRAGRNLEHVVRRNGAQARRLFIPREALWPDYGEGEDGEPDAGNPGEPGAGAADSADSIPDPLEASEAPETPPTVPTVDEWSAGQQMPYTPYTPDALTYAGDTLAGGEGFEHEDNGDTRGASGADGIQNDIQTCPHCGATDIRNYDGDRRCYACDEPVTIQPTRVEPGKGCEL
jgi:hypothetical protein